MGRLTVFIEAEQLSLDDMLAEFRAEAPPEVTTAVEKGASGPTIGADPEVIMADLDTQGDVSEAKIGTELHNGLCPFMAECYEALGLVSQHCSWNQDDPPTWRFCGAYKEMEATTMSWKPFQVPHSREDAIESARWLRDRIAGIPEPGKPVLPERTRERVLKPQLERVLEAWSITEAELEV